MINRQHFRVAAFGEILWDMLPSGPVIGGAPLNFTYRINELGNQGTIISCVGDDEYGKRAEQHLQQWGLSTEYVQRQENLPTGTVEIALDAQQEPHYTITPAVAYDQIRYQPELTPLVHQADCFCFGTLAQRDDISRQTLHDLLDHFSGQYVLYDVNLRPNTYTPEIIDRSIRRANVLKINEDEATELADICQLSATALPDIGRTLLARYSLSHCLITLGERGVLALSADGTTCYVPTFQINLVDPLGAGDSFTAGFTHALLWKQPLDKACRFGNALGAAVASQPGGTQRVEGSSVKMLLERGRSGPVDLRFKHLL